LNHSVVCGISRLSLTAERKLAHVVTVVTGTHSFCM